jgi:probable selenium-dependent hydroxylase accessory protein YqeC
MNISNLIFKNVSEAQNACIGILGGGGKTALLHALGNELAKTFQHVILSSLTKAGISTAHEVHLYPEFQDEENREQLLANNPLYIMGEKESEIKFLGVNAAMLATLFRASDLTLFECDGARKKPIKAHQPYDPMIPHFATHAVIVVGADAVGAKIDGKRVHRPELFRELWDVNADFKLTPAFIAKVLTSQYGYLQKVPPDVEVIYLVNKADSYPEQALSLAQALSRLSKSAVFFGSVEQGNFQQAV